MSILGVEPRVVKPAPTSPVCKLCRVAQVLATAPQSRQVAEARVLLRDALRVLEIPGDVPPTATAAQRREWIERGYEGLRGPRPGRTRNPLDA